MKYFGIVGIGLLLIGLITLDWFKIILGLLIFLIGFGIDLKNKKAAVNNELIFSVYHGVHDLLRVIVTTVESSHVDFNDAKVKNILALIITGFTDAASQAKNLSDNELMGLLDSVFSDLDHHYDKSFQAKLFVYYKTMYTDSVGFPMAMKGGELYMKSLGGSKSWAVSVPEYLDETLKNMNVPERIENFNEPLATK